MGRDVGEEGGEKAPQCHSASASARRCARGTCWRPPSDLEDLEDLEAPSSPAQRWHGCRFGSDVSDVSCFGMFWKSLIFLDGHIVMQNTQTSHSAGSSEIAKQLNDGSNP